MAAQSLRELRDVLRRRRARAAEQATLDELSFLSDAGLVLSSSLEPQRIADMVASLAVPRLGDGAMLFLRSGDDIELAAVVHTDPSVASLLRSLVSERTPQLSDDVPPGLVLRTGQTWYVPFVDEAAARSVFVDDVGYVLFRRARIGPNVTVPVPGRGRVLGALMLVRESGRYSPVEITMAEHLARRSAAALENAQLFRAVQESALTLQRSLLPGTPPAVDGADIAMDYRPGTAGTEVGGDLYDVIPLSGGRIGVAIGDVMGRGLRAAAVMGQLRAALRAYALEGWGPAELLFRLDRVVDSLPGLQMATCLYVIYDPASNSATVSNAGHLPPLLVLTDEEPDYLVLDPGLPLGVGEGGGFSETTLALPPGSSIVLFTDGLVESRRQPLADGMDRLRLGLSQDAGHHLDAAEPGLGDVEPGPGDMEPGPGDVEPGLADREPGPAAREPGPDVREPGPDVRVSGQRNHADRRTGRDRHRGRERRFGTGAVPATVPAAERRSLARATQGGRRVVEGSARALLDRCLLAAGRSAQSDDDTALLVLSTYPVRPPLLQMSLPADPVSAGRARSQVGRVLCASGLAGLHDDATLLVSEVVTNAVLHARSDLVLRVTLDLGRLRVSVEDREGASLPRQLGRGDYAESGWGLLLVDSLSDAWGVETTSGGKRVWFDLPLPPAEGTHHSL